MLVLEPSRATSSRFDERGRLTGCFTSDSRDATVTIDVEFREWRDVDGYGLPTLVLVHATEGAFQLEFDELAPNAVDESLFDPSA